MSHDLIWTRNYNHRRRRSPVRVVGFCIWCEKSVSINETGCVFRVTKAEAPNFFEALAGECDAKEARRP